MDKYNEVLRIMDDATEKQYGIRPYGTKREQCEHGNHPSICLMGSCAINQPTVQELTISEMVGRPVRINK